MPTKEEIRKVRILVQMIQEEAEAYKDTEDSMFIYRNLPRLETTLLTLEAIERNF